jgi:exopolysaccharide biosynthesis polyprenyl glycosylphosphotransferase
MVVDGVSVLLVLWVIGQIRPLLNTSMIKAIDAPQILPPSVYILFSIVWVGIMIFFSVYDGHKNLRIVDEFTNLTLSSILAGITLAGFLYFTYRDTSRALYILFVSMTYIIFLLWRVLARILYWGRNNSMAHTQRILILGAGPIGLEIRDRINEHAYLNINFTGFLDDNQQKKKNNPEILGALDDARTLIKNSQVTDVVIALPSRAYQRINQLVQELQDLPVKVWVVPDYFQFALHHAKVEDFLNIPMLDLRAPALSENQRMIKRIFDLVFGILMMLFALPLMGFISLLILSDDGLPILFKQKRVGENGRLFTMYKFRTMIKNAEQLRRQVEQSDENGNIIHKFQNDPRVTRVGSILRRLSFDEFPQLFNVLRGTMSLVGPRPELPYLVEKYQPWQRKRFAIPQGMTGWWQIHGRSDKPMHLHTEDDLYYVQNYSIWLDIQILVRTVWIVIRGKGAY